MIERISGQRQPQQAVQHRPAAAGGFEAALQQELSRQAADGVAFSKHAMSRAEERRIEITPSLMDTEKAFIINVPSAKVITAITQDEMKDSVFTNIDGAVFL